MSNTILAAMPLYRSVPAEWLFRWFQLDKTPLVGQVATEGAILPVAMRNLVDLAFDAPDHWDYLLIYEHDMIPPPYALLRMSNYREEHDIVGTVYFGRDVPHYAMAYMQAHFPCYSPITTECVKAMIGTPALYQVDAVAMGFTAIHRRVFENWDKTVPMWDAQPPLVGHDLHFCNEAMKQGFGIFLDSGIVSEHLTMVGIGLQHSERAMTETDLTKFSDVRTFGEPIPVNGHH